MICRVQGEPSSYQSLLRRPVSIPTDEEDYALIEAAQAGSIDARNEMIVRHLPAIIRYASEYHQIRRRPKHVELEDLIHVGVFGIIHAIRKYERRKRAGGRFITYAKYWMRNYMDKAVNEYRMFRIPESTEFAYKTGRLNKPSTKAAIEHFRHIRFLSEDECIIDRGSSPVDEAIIHEEYQNVERDGTRTQTAERRKKRTAPLFFKRKPRTKTGAG